MKLVKYLVTTAAITAVTAAMAVSASAAIELGTDNDFTVSVNEETKKVSLSDIGTINGDQMTMLILNNDAETVAEGDIEQIDQVATATSWADIALSELTVGQTYYVRIGGDGTIKTASFTVKEDGGTSPSQYRKGDVDRSGGLPDSKDSYLVLKWDAELEELDEEQQWLGEVDGIEGDWPADSKDSYEILKFDAELESAVDQYYPELFE